MKNSITHTGLIVAEIPPSKLSALYGGVLNLNSKEASIQLGGKIGCCNRAVYNDLIVDAGVCLATDAIGGCEACVIGAVLIISMEH